MPEWFEIEPITSRVYLDAELRAKIRREEERLA